jgi:uncharacterized membrane protein
VDLCLAPLGIVCIFFGLWALFDSESSWKLDNFIRYFEGRSKTERTAFWECLNRFTGLYFVILGLVLLVLTFISNTLIFPYQVAFRSFANLMYPPLFGSCPLGKV